MAKRLYAGLLLVAFTALSSAQNSQLTFKGRVKDTNGKGIAGVVVNNGEQFTLTDDKGSWTLPTDTNRCKMVSISTPAAYKLPQENSLAKGFYVRVDQLSRDGGKHDFVLEKRTTPCDKFYYIAISDPQVRNAKQLARWQNETVEDLRSLTTELSTEREVVANTLGDLVWDNMPLFSQYEQSLQGLPMTIFQCIGNHDFDLRYQDLHNMPAGTPCYGEQAYHAHFGPTCYSYNIGRIHVVTLKNINYVGGRQYVEAITGEDLQWLSCDLSYVEKGSQVILNMHAAGWNSVEKEGNIRNAKQLAEILKDYRVNIFAGHTHYFQNNTVSDHILEHNIGASCGAWWNEWVNRCGAPNGYMVVDIDGDNVKWHYKSTRHSLNHQMRLYAVGEFPSQQDCVVANVWDWDERTTVEYSIDGQPMGPMEQFTDCDPVYISCLKKGSAPTKTRHLFRAKPTEGAKQITVTFTNRFGEKYSESLPLTQSKVVAHRGFWRHEGSAQNSIASMRFAAETTPYGMETDVQLTADSFVVVNHDADINGLPIATTQLAELKAQTLANGEHPSTLDEYLEELRQHPSMRLLVELKGQKQPGFQDELARRVVGLVNARGLRHQVVVISDSLNACRAAKAADPRMSVFYDHGDLTPQQIKDLGFQGFDYSHKVLAKHPEWVEEAHRLGLVVGGWTANTPETILPLVDMGVDLITTNEPLLTKQLCR